MSLVTDFFPLFCLIFVTPACPYHSIYGHVVIVQGHAGGAGVAVDWVVQVGVGRDGALAGETGDKTQVSSF